MLSISDLDFSYEKNIILKDLSIEIESGNIVGIMGPSGCGKSTLLRVISGFLSPTKGSIYLNKVNILPLQPQVRSTSMIFQGYSLFPHFTVFENLEYGLKIRKISSNIRKMRVEEILTMLELEEYKNVDVRFLSGGQKQRVAIGRSLAIEPDLLLLDEPLSAVDEKLRDDLRVIIRKVLKKKKITGLLVSHSFQDNVSICDKVAFWDSMKLTDAKKVDTWMQNPITTDIAEFIGYKNIYLSKWIKQFDKSLNFKKKYIVIPENSITLNKNALSSKEKLMISIEGKVIDFKWRNAIRVMIVLINGEKIEFPLEANIPRGSILELFIDKSKIIEIN